MQIGVIVPLLDKKPIFQPVVELGLKTCQLCSWSPAKWTPENVERVVKESAETGVRISAMWAGWSGPHVWNFTDGPETLGLVPPAYRFQRCNELKQAADFAKAVGTRAIITHAGFLPENLSDPLFPGTVAGIRDVAAYCKQLGLGFWYETGQETPVALLRIIEAVGLDNQGVNLDPANLILYGKGNPVDALDVFGPWVRSLHVKDGVYPTSGGKLGRETPVGEGKVDFPKLLAALKKLGFDDDLIIEREISGDKQRRDILAAIAELKRLGATV